MKISWTVLDSWIVVLCAKNGVKAEKNLIEAVIAWRGLTMLWDCKQIKVYSLQHLIYMILNNDADRIVFACDEVVLCNNQDVNERNIELCYCIWNKL